ncbi:MAG TPA: pyridoxal phosphate-dependent aminotransferase [Smithellaceae bacterium]|nr:pyridoxal phosphate-dependent aminotransferase [Smithellaceae bacterium]
MAIAKKIKATFAQSSLIRKMFDEGAILKKKHGAHKVYDFSLGNPNVEPPEEFKKELLNIAAHVMPNKHGYAPNAGFPETRHAVAEKIKKTTGLNITFDHVIMSNGAAGALNVIFKSILDPGDEVIVPVPYFVEYPFYIDNFGGIIKFVKTKHDFSLDVMAIGLAINSKTKAVLINTPNNPTGKVYSQQNIDELAALLEEKGRQLGKAIYLLSDEPYNEIVYDGVFVPNILKSYKNSIIAYSYSKTLSLPGERIGYIAVNPAIEDGADLLHAMTLCTRILGYVNAPALMQRIIAKLQYTKVDVEVYHKKRNLICDGLAGAGYQFEKPMGAFYLFPQSPIPDDVKFAEMLLTKNILVVPGSGFGSPGYFRIAFCVDDATIINSLAGFAETISECQK